MSENKGSYPTVKIQKYRTEISNSVFEGMRGMGYKITEFFIPEHNLCFNTDTGSLNVFYYDTRRSNDYEEVEIPKNQVKLIKDYHELKIELYDLLRMFQNNISPTTKTEEKE